MRMSIPMAFLVAMAGALSGCGTAMYTVGDTGPGGGTVFYVAAEPFPCGPTLSSRCTYLEAALPEAESIRVWDTELDPETETPGAGRSGLGAGAANTQEILAVGSTDPDISAAAYAATYEQNGYRDWYLPSKFELFELYSQSAATEVLGAGTYWSSTDYAFITAWAVDFNEGSLHRRLQIDQLVVRPIRAF